MPGPLSIATVRAATATGGDADASKAAFHADAAGELSRLRDARQRSRDLTGAPLGVVDGFEADVVDPHLADVAGEAEFEGQAGGLALGAEDPLDLHPAADGREALHHVALAEGLPGARRLAILDDRRLPVALGARGDQVPEAEAHPGAVADRALLEAIRLVARNVRLDVQAVGRGDEDAGVAAIGGRVVGAGPAAVRLAGEVRLAVERQVVLDLRAAQRQLDGPGPEQGVVGAVEEVVVLQL